MASRYYSTEEVVDILDSDVEDEEVQDFDDPQEVLMEGSDEEFGGLENLDTIENGTVTNKKQYFGVMKNFSYADKDYDLSGESWQLCLPSRRPLSPASQSLLIQTQTSSPFGAQTSSQTQTSSLRFHLFLAATLHQPHLPLL